MIRNFFREYFVFTRGERNGTVVLATLMLALFAYPHLHGFFAKPTVCLADPELIAEIRAFYGEDNFSRQPSTYIPTEPVNPDTGGPGPESDTSLTPLWPAFTGQSTGVESEPVRIDLNSADTSDLIQIRGIGPVLSRRILRYRDILGGYSNVEQLKEVYGIEEERYLQINGFFYTDSEGVSKLRLSDDEFSVLLRHPYLDFDQVSQIFSLRNSEGINSMEDLIRTSAFSQSDILRLKPYLEFGRSSNK